jgi:hypothetical protein
MIDMGFATLVLAVVAAAGIVVPPILAGRTERRRRAAAERAAKSTMVQLLLVCQTRLAAISTSPSSVHADDMLSGMEMALSQAVSEGMADALPAELFQRCVLAIAKADRAVLQCATLQQRASPPEQAIKQVADDALVGLGSALRLVNK